MRNKCEEKRHSIIITICCDAFLLKTTCKCLVKKPQYKEDKIKNFSELDVYDEEGKRLPFEETITEEDNVFHDSGSSPSFTNGQRVLLRLALKTMTEKQRKVLVCLEYEGMSQEETAKKLNITQQAVNDRYQSALKKLRKFCLDK